MGGAQSNFCVGQVGNLKAAKICTSKNTQKFNKIAYANVAQSVVHRLGKAEVTGSSPVISSKNKNC